jgi:hypothetical protein
MALTNYYTNGILEYYKHKWMWLQFEYGDRCREFLWNKYIIQRVETVQADQYSYYIGVSMPITIYLAIEHNKYHEQKQMWPKYWK